MSKAIKYLEQVSNVDDDDIEIVTLNEAIIACELQELATLEAVIGTPNGVLTGLLTTRYQHLTKKLNNIKIK